LGRGEKVAPVPQVKAKELEHSPLASSDSSLLPAEQNNKTNTESKKPEPKKGK
jgi:hypothetical protein